jgi:hypothetical protein
MRLEGVRWGVE